MNARSYFVYVLSDNGTPFYAAPAVIARGEQVEKSDAIDCGGFPLPSLFASVIAAFHSASV
ncbi:MAG: hypothetical protein ACLP4V_08225 [Methylocella sp.]